MIRTFEHFIVNHFLARVKKISFNIMFTQKETWYLKFHVTQHLDMKLLGLGDLVGGVGVFELYQHVRPIYFFLMSIVFLKHMFSEGYSSNSNIVEKEKLHLTTQLSSNLSTIFEQSNFPRISQPSLSLINCA